MKLLFVHDAERLKEDKDGKFYTDGAYSIEVWDRYFLISDDLKVIFRKDNEKYEVSYAKERFNSVKEGIKFIEVVDRTASIKAYISPKNRKVNDKIIKNAVLDCDCLIVRLPCDAGYTAIKYARRHNKPYLIEVVGCVWDSYWNYSFKGKVLALPNYLKMKSHVKDAKYAIYVTEKFLQKRYPCRGLTTNCSNVMLPTINEHIINKRIAKIENMDNNKPIILGTAAAVDVKYKGQQYVIEAITHLNKQGYNYEYHLAGNGDSSYLKALVKQYEVEDKVKFLGSMPHDKIYDWLDNIDVYIQPSVTEGLPRSLVEAMSRGCPSVGSQAGGIPELLEIGYTFKKRSIKEICSLLLSLNKEQMYKQAVRNFHEAQKYNKNIINERRKDFLLDFHRSIEND